MWHILEHRTIAKTSKKLQPEIVKKYELWKGLVFRHGPDILRQFPGFHDEQLTGTRSGQRSSRLNQQYRVIYTVERDTISVYVIEINTHDYYRMSATEVVKMKKIIKPEFVQVKQHATLTTGEVIRMLRELKGWTQEKLAGHCGLHATNISMLENNRVDIGKKRAEQLARAFGVHPAIIMFPEYESVEFHKAA